MSSTTAYSASSIPTRADNVELSPRISEDWLSLIIGLLIFALALAGLANANLIGWVVTASVWVDLGQALKTVSSRYASLGGIGALCVLAFVFASMLAFVPLLMAVVSIPTTFLLVWAMTTVTDVSFIVEFLVALIGLGVAIDYALLIVVRWREERAHGADNETAVIEAMRTAGGAVVFSGTTVAVGST